VIHTLEIMKVHLASDLQTKLDKMAAETGAQKTKDELVQDAMAGFFEELSAVREMLDGRYDDIKSGRVKPLDGEETLAHFRHKTEARRANRS
jgi:hypothetical protein